MGGKVVFLYRLGNIFKQLNVGIIGYGSFWRIHLLVLDAFHVGRTQLVNNQEIHSQSTFITASLIIFASGPYRLSELFR